MHPLKSGEWIRSPGHGFSYRVIAPVCRLYDREELPWPCCSLQWKGKAPSWKRVGPRLVPDLACSRCPSYYVQAFDQWGNTWTQVLTLYYQRLNEQEKTWWITKKPKAKPFPSSPEGLIGQNFFQNAA